MELVHIAANKNTVPGDVSAMVPGGIRMGKSHWSSHLAFMNSVQIWARKKEKQLYTFLYFDLLYLNLKKSFCFYGLGTPALTSRGFLEDDFVKVAELFDASVKLALKIKAASTG